MALIKDILNIYEEEGQTEIEVEGTCADCGDIVTVTLNLDDPDDIKGWREPHGCEEKEFATSVAGLTAMNERDFCKLAGLDPSELTDAI